ncbi:YwmB family TATA-box binding protein [Clostridiaceae bacterium M8S5]|nr:YwmB family TATA-box binding protein [Clostridiaceae bacterium M8S5]
MKKILGIIFILFVCLINFTSAEEVENNEPKDTIATSFNATQAEFLEANLNASDKIGDKFLTIEELEKLINDKFYLKEEGENIKAENIQLKEILYTDKIDSEDNRQIIVYGKDIDDDYITLYLSTFGDEKYQETSLCIELNADDINKIKLCENKISNTFLSFKAKPHITTCITGTYKGELNQSKRYKMVYKALDSVGAKVIEGLDESSLISVSAYSPKLKDYIYSGDKKMNLNVAMRYNEYENKTYLWMATPLITTGY